MISDRSTVRPPCAGACSLEGRGLSPTHSGEGSPRWAHGMVRGQPQVGWRPWASPLRSACLAPAAAALPGGSWAQRLSRFPGGKLTHSLIAASEPPEFSCR